MTTTELAAHRGRGRSFEEEDVDRARPWRRLLRGLYASETAHRAVPWGVARHVVRAEAAARWHRSTVRDDALAQMTFLLGASARAGEIDAIARRYVTVQRLLAERLWRPWIPAARPILRLEHLDEALSRGRGVIVSIMHQGDYNAIVPPLRRLGLGDVVVPASPVHFFGEYKIGPRQGIRTATWHGGCTVINAAGSFDALREHLSRPGQIAEIAWDMPGRTEVTFLGRRVRIASGTARLAFATGSVVVPFLVDGSGDGEAQPLVAAEPLDPYEHATPAAFMQAVAAAHEAAVLAWPEGLVLPRERWHPVEDADLPR